MKKKKRFNMSKRVERVTSEAAIDELLADSDGEDPLVISESEEEEESKSQAKAKKPSLFQRAKKRMGRATFQRFVGEDGAILLQAIKESLSKHSNRSIAKQVKKDIIKIIVKVGMLMQEKILTQRHFAATTAHIVAIARQFSNGLDSVTIISGVARPEASTPKLPTDLPDPTAIVRHLNQLHDVMLPVLQSVLTPKNANKLTSVINVLSDVSYITKLCSDPEYYVHRVAVASTLSNGLEGWASNQTDQSDPGVRAVLAALERTPCAASGCNEFRIESDESLAKLEEISAQLATIQLEPNIDHLNSPISSKNEVDENKSDVITQEGAEAALALAETEADPSTKPPGFHGSHYCIAHHILKFHEAINSPNVTLFITDVELFKYFKIILHGEEESSLCKFIFSIEDFNSIGRSKLRSSRAQLVWDKYFSTTATNSLRLLVSPDILDRISNGLDEDPIRNSIFQDALEQVTRILEDVFRDRFLGSPIHHLFLSHYTLPERFQISPVEAREALRSNTARRASVSSAS